MYVRMNVYIISTHECICLCMHACIYECMYVCMQVCMYVSMHNQTFELYMYKNDLM